MIRNSPLSDSTRIFIVLSVIAAALYFGGTAWTQIFLTAIVFRSLPDFRDERLLLMACSLIWLAIGRWLVFSQLFFPYTIHLATCVLLFGWDSDLRRGYIRGMIVVAVFLAFRFLQCATNRVLSIEFAVAAVILALVIYCYPLTPRNTVARTIMVIAASLCAVGGLAL